MRPARRKVQGRNGGRRARMAEIDRDTLPTVAEARPGKSPLTLRGLQRTIRRPAVVSPTGTSSPDEEQAH